MEKVSDSKRVLSSELDNVHIAEDLVSRIRSYLSIMMIEELSVLAAINLEEHQIIDRLLVRACETDGELTALLIMLREHQKKEEKVGASSKE